MEINNSIPAAALPAAEPRVRGSLASPQGNDAAAAKKVAREFEAMFLGMVMKSMRQTVVTDSLAGGGRAEETFRSLLDQEYAAAAAGSGGIGLARMIEKELAGGTAGPAVAKGGKYADSGFGLRGGPLSDGGGQRK